MTDEGDDATTTASCSRQHEAMQQRFRMQQEARLRSREEVRERGREMKDPKECAEAFWDNLRKTYDDVSECIESLKATDESERGGADAVTATLVKLITRVQGLERRLTDATRYLPPYDVRRAQEEIASMLSQIEDARGLLVPKKKFSFARRKKQQEGATAATPPPLHGTPATADVALQEPLPGASAPSTAMADRLPETTDSNDGAEPDMDGFSLQLDASLNIDDLVLPGDGERGRDLLLSRLTRCTVRLLRPLSFLRLEQLTDCKVYVGPVAGPVYLESCTGGIIHLASRQLRIHNTSSCDLYVHVASGPILEDCSGLRFAPYCMTYPALAAHMKESQLDGMPNCWNDVKDFKWLRMQQSPNWSVLPEAERVTVDADVGQTAVGDSREDDEDEI